MEKEKTIETRNGSENYSEGFLGVLERQFEFNSNFFDSEKATLSKREKYTKDTVSLMMIELTEVMNEINYKKHVKKKKKVNLHDLQVEIIDCIKYNLNLCHVWGIDYETFLKLFHDKSAIVEDSHKKQKKK